MSSARVHQRVVKFGEGKPERRPFEALRRWSRAWNGRDRHLRCLRLSRENSNE